VHEAIATANALEGQALGAIVEEFVVTIRYVASNWTVTLSTEHSSPYNS
jgi:hypothetical protein